MVFHHECHGDFTMKDGDFTVKLDDFAYFTNKQDQLLRSRCDLAEMMVCRDGIPKSM